ncbi:MAG: ArsR/SmtB family transcription factor [Alphaproteobacteria bacterium]
MKKTVIKSGAKLLKALGNDKRLEIVSLLLDGEKSVNELVEVVGVSQSSLSQHLAVLRKEKILKTRRVSQTIYYSINCDKTMQILDIMGILDKNFS